MPYRITHEGHVVECETAAEAAALLKLLIDGPKPKALDSRRTGHDHVVFGNQPLTKAARRQLRKLTELLGRVERAGQEGLEVGSLAADAGLSQSKGLGVFVAATNRFLRGHQITFDDAVVSVRDRDGIKRWKAEPRIREVLEILRGLK